MGKALKRSEIAALNMQVFEHRSVKGMFNYYDKMIDAQKETLTVSETVTNLLGRKKQTGNLVVLKNRNFGKTPDDIVSAMLKIGENIFGELVQDEKGNRDLKFFTQEKEGEYATVMHFSVDKNGELKNFSQPSTDYLETSTGPMSSVVGRRMASVVKTMEQVEAGLRAGYSNNMIADGVFGREVEHE
ncbi:MAG: hypothetical protein IJA61_00705 [Clostridia bacterium]|nr:hypothetical protein [Clostridia bacterium]